MPTNIIYKNNVLKTASTLDLIIANETIATKCKSVNTMPISPVYNNQLSYYHIPIVAEFDLETKPRKKRTSFHKAYLYDKVKWDTYKNDMDNFISKVGAKSAIDSLNLKLHEAINAAAKNNIPKAQEKIRRYSNFPDHIVQALKSRNHWAKRFKEFRDRDSAIKEYIESEALVNEMIRVFRIKQWISFLETQGPHPLSSVPFWKRINRLRSNKRQKPIETLIINGVRYDEDIDKSNVFSENLEKKFKSENNPRYNANLKENIENFF